MFKAFTVDWVKEMVKNEISTIVSNSKLSIVSSKISPDKIEGFYILTIDNKHAKSVPIPQFSLRALVSNIGISSHFFCWGVKNIDNNNVSDKSEAVKGIELEDKINQDNLFVKLIRPAKNAGKISYLRLLYIC